jgi:hypothetical protein
MDVLNQLNRLDYSDADYRLWSSTSSPCALPNEILALVKAVSIFFRVLPPLDLGVEK